MAWWFLSIAALAGMSDLVGTCQSLDWATRNHIQRWIPQGIPRGIGLDGTRVGSEVQGCSAQEPGGGGERIMSMFTNTAADLYLS